MHLHFVLMFLEGADCVPLMFNLSDSETKTRAQIKGVHTTL